MTSRRSRSARSFNGRFGPYNEYEVMRAKDTIERLVANSNNVGVHRLLTKAYQCPIKWGGYDRFQYYSKPLFPNASDWPAPKIRVTQTSTTESSESVNQCLNTSESLRQTKNDTTVGNDKDFFVIDTKGNRPAEREESNTVEELSKESHDLYQTNVNRWNSVEEDGVIVIEEEEGEDCMDGNEKNRESVNIRTSDNTESGILMSEGSRELEASKEVEEGELLERGDETDRFVQQQLLRGVEMVVRLKCDVCSYNVEGFDVVTMRDHLNKEKHYGASLFEGYMYESEFSPVYVVEREAVRTQETDISTVIPMCPLCAEVFPSIWTCEIHAVRQHNRSVYGVGKVVDTKVILVSEEPKCDKCGHVFDAQKNLHKHWRSTMLHYPYELPTLNQVTVFSCLYCSTYFSSFVTARLHSCKKHKDRKSRPLGVGLKVIYVEKSTEQIRLPSLKPIQGSQQWLNRNTFQAEMAHISIKQLQNRFSATDRRKNKKKKKKKDKSKGVPVICAFDQP
ncbi:hypothetical protein FSP39_024938 [Pinctada imbricata]|uniref:C2H2-type domain-containing protein n=1 Tax=Pinctada imbricata TaxID=66713 RepID=A0AA88Y7C3_PINIB|nr:hypothetical protein FSP39_024938 [Pinctada imbricata]